jgi:hypothetical protein
MIKVNGNGPVNIELDDIHFNVFNRENGAMLHILLTEKQARVLMERLNTIFPVKAITFFSKPKEDFSQADEIKKNLDIQEAIANRELASQSEHFWKTL